MKKVVRQYSELFYVELPQTDFLNDIEIQDEYENSSYDEIQGLSIEQVSKLTLDSLERIYRHPHSHATREESVSPPKLPRPEKA